MTLYPEIFAFLQFHLGELANRDLSDYKTVHLHNMHYINGSGVDRRGQGGGHPFRSSDKRSCCLRNAQICNKIGALEGSFEGASAAALFYLKKGYIYIKTGVSLIFKVCGQNIFLGGLAP